VILGFVGLGVFGSAQAAPLYYTFEMVLPDEFYEFTGLPNEGLSYYVFMVDNEAPSIIELDGDTFNYGHTINYERAPGYEWHSMMYRAELVTGTGLIFDAKDRKDTSYFHTYQVFNSEGINMDSISILTFSGSCANGHLVLNMHPNIPSDAMKSYTNFTQWASAVTPGGVDVSLTITNDKGDKRRFYGISYNLISITEMVPTFLDP
jgi:hypothetical protein